MSSGALIVAAGFSRRFGSDKRLFELKFGEPLIVASVRPFRTVFSNVAIVVRSSDSELSRLLAEHYGRRAPIVVPTDQAHRGMAASIADGVRALAAWDYLFLGLGDMPYVRTDSLERLKFEMDAARAERAPCIVVPTLDGVPGHPVGFSHHFFAELIALTGDRGARAVVAAHPESVRNIELDDPGILADIDEPPM